MDREQALHAYTAVREASMAMSGPLEPEEYRLQVAEYASPVWWNLGHSSWFFAQLLREFGGEVAEEDATYGFLLNSYYAGLGDKIARDRRGSVTRPTTWEVLEYRASVDERMARLLRECSDASWPSVWEHVTLGMQHEQQHQELFYTEIKLLRAQNPARFRIAYCDTLAPQAGTARPAGWVRVEGGLREFGNLEGGFGWDNEYAIHQRFVPDFQMMDRLVTAGEFLEFMEDGGYGNELLWLSNGWAACQTHGWSAPLYWERDGDAWNVWTLCGTRSLDSAAPVSHLSFYEADAFANWKRRQGGEYRHARIPTEYEWELACRQVGDPSVGNFLDSRAFQPQACTDGPGYQLMGDAWEWTTSYYEPYPGYEPYEGFLSEYNGKFMDNQRVLRGGSCVSERNHLRPSYRNFWPADTRFQFSGFRLVRSDGDA